MAGRLDGHAEAVRDGPGDGGGDVGLAFFSEKPAADEFRARCSEKVLVLDIGLGATGAYRRLPSGIETFKKD